MDILILDKTFRKILILDIFESFIWTDRYNSFGDVEIYTKVDKELLEIIKQDFYIWSPQSEHLMIIDVRHVTTDVEVGNHLIISGRSLESILDRRIIWNQTILNGNFQDQIRRLLVENIINPDIVSRRISNFKFDESTDPIITSLTIKAQFTGVSLYDAIQALCENKNIGFKVVLNDYNQFVFTLYSGIDRSYKQTINPYVIFSPNFENIINSDYLESTRIIKNVALVAGEGEGFNRRKTSTGDLEAVELDRREIFVDARDISSTTNDTTLSNEEYMSQLAQRGAEKLSEHTLITAFDGEVDPTQMFVLGRDFFLGDTVQIVNEFGLEASTRVSEIVFSNNNSGNTIVPTFKVVT